MGWGQTSLVEHLPSTKKALNWISVLCTICTEKYKTKFSWALSHRMSDTEKVLEIKLNTFLKYIGSGDPNLNTKTIRENNKPKKSFISTLAVK